MTSNSNELLVRVREFVARGGEVDERVDSLILRGPLSDAAAQSAWLDLVASTKATSLSVQLYHPAIGGDLATSDTFDPTREVIVTVAKPQIAGVTCFFLQDQLGDYLQGGCIAPDLRVADLGVQNGFTARGLRIEPWDLAAAITAQTKLTAIDPTPFVRDFVPVREIAADVSPWILLAPPTSPSAAFASWKAVASRRLLGSLVSSAWLEDGVVWLQASGPPLFRLRADRQDIESAFDQLTQAINWVFLSGQDIEARHIIFANELARSDRTGQTLPETLIRALEAAKATYEAHVQSASRETLRTLSDLRKTVIDEAQKVTQKTQDLTASLWRDLAITAAPFVLKILGDAGKVANPIVAACFYFAAAIFITLSFLLQWRINGAFFASQSKSRAAWMQALYGYISARERQEIADTPIKGALRNYLETRTILAVVYAVLFLILIGFGTYTLRGGGSTTTAAAGTHQTGQNPPLHTLTLPRVVPKCVPTPKMPCPKSRS